MENNYVHLLKHFTIIMYNLAFSILSHFTSAPLLQKEVLYLLPHYVWQV